MRTGIKLKSKDIQLSLFPTATENAADIDTIYQYLLVLSPPEEIREKVSSLRHQLNEVAAIGNYNLNSVPHITLTSLQMVRPLSDRLIRNIQKVMTAFEPVNIELEAIQAFTHGKDAHTVYIGIKNAPVIDPFYKILTAFLGLPAKAFMPHLTLARTIHSEGYEKMAALIENTFFKDAFMCQSITVLERTVQKEVAGHYNVVKEIKLGAA